MNIANFITSLRLYLSPVFFIFAFLPYWTAGRFGVLSTVALWVLFVVIELSDVLDGMVARRQKIVSDVGKLLDPFADVVSRLTYFVVFTAFSIMPVWMFILILYREVGIIFVRMMMIRDGVALAARKGGKLKAVMYAVSAALGLLMLMHLRVQNLHGLMPALPWVTIGAFGVSVLLSWGSMIDYLLIIRRHYRESGSRQ
ncbi:MAG TPA: CDP-diacylglycerol--glycerol-3-phosphate 3-phosphatidyltransferase [Tichowtungia sp.]|nr:CDP-diacylglycerol--glycerol-3-phosphate 3-phosphatidyltransferase [Tichowtungia sp.]